jgi:hypothetical protein
LQLITDLILPLSWEVIAIPDWLLHPKHRILDVHDTPVDTADCELFRGARLR